MTARTVEALRIAAHAAALWFSESHPRRCHRATYWRNRAQAYADAASAETARPGIHAVTVISRAEALSVACGHRALAWQALAAGEAQDAAHHLRQSRKFRATAPGVGPGVWR